VRLIMAGAGDNWRRKLDSRSREWGLEEKIRLVRVRNDVPRMMLGSDLLLFPSLAEGLGMVVVEAQAAGLRVLASDTTPRECSVVPELLSFLSLDLSPREWADEAERLMKADHSQPDDCLEAIRRSPFSIENSVASLLRSYKGDN